MTAPTYADATTVETSDQIRDKMLTVIEADGADVAGWPSTAPQRGLVEGSARALAYQEQLRAQMAKTKSPTDCIAAGSSWVDARVAWFKLDDGAGGVGRIKATRALWDIPVVCTAAASPMTIDNASKIVIQASGGQYFESAQSGAVVLNSGNSYKSRIRFQARSTGTAAGNVQPSSFGTIVSAPAGLSFDSGATAPSLVTAARDDETDLAYVTRALGEWGKLGVAWTLAAFDYWIPLFAPTVTRWRVRDDNSYGPGSVGLILANASGPATGGEVAAIQAMLGNRNVRALGSGKLLALAATADNLTINITIEGDGTNSSLGTNARAAVLALCNAMPMGVATLDDGIVRAVALGGTYPNGIPIDVGGGLFQTIKPTLAGFTGAVSIVSCDLAAPHTIPIDRVLVPTVNVTVS